ncbi:MAG: hypothetical protein RIT47_541, partial [Pseudomonadota bacterium]
FPISVTLRDFYGGVLALDVTIDKCG